MLLSASVTIALDIYGITQDIDGSYTAAGASSTAKSGVIQGSNSPSILSSGLSDIISGAASKVYKRRTKDSSVKFYVKCIGGSVAAGSTYTLSYSLDGANDKTVGSSYTQTSNPFVLIEELDDGAHTLTVTCTENANSISSTTPATSVTEHSPLIFNWITDTSGSPSVSFDSAPPDITNSKSTTLYFSGSRSTSSYISGISWMCSLVKEGKDEDYVSCGCTTKSCTYVADQNSHSDAKYSFKAKVTYTYVTDCTSTPYYCTDLPSKSGEKGSSWWLDTTPPSLAITSTPAAKSQYTTGKTAKFEFGCKNGEISCAYQCLYDGMDSADATSTRRAKGFFDCTSPVTLTVKNSTTHSFAAKAIDAAGNESPISDLYMFYADGTSPTVEFLYMDASESFTTQQLASGSMYYSVNNDYTVNGGRLYTTSGGFAQIDDVNGNTNDTSTTAAATSTVQFTCTSTACNSVCGSPCSTSTYAPTDNTKYHTVVQFPYDPTKAVYELSGTYGAILAMKSVNGIYYYNVLDTTNADFGSISYQCVHTEMAA